MSDSGTNQSNVVTRFCPECSTKVKAPAQKFSQPQKCPSCSKIVLFWDLNVEQLEAKSHLDWIDKKFKTNLFPLAIGLAVTIVFIGAILFAYEMIILPMLLCIVVAAVGVVGFGFVLAQTAEFKNARSIAKETIKSLSSVRASHREIVNKYYLLKEHMSSLVEEKKSSLVSEFMERVEELEAKRTAVKQIEDDFVRKCDESRVRMRELEDSYQLKRKEVIDSAYCH